MITGVQDIYYNVSDMKAAIAFYVDMLGMLLVDEDEYWSSLEIGGVRIGLHGNQGEPVPAIPHDAHGAHCGATLTLRSDNIDADERRLRARGVTILGRSDEVWGSIVVFQDPDGNVLKLMQPVA